MTIDNSSDATPAAVPSFAQLGVDPTLCAYLTTLGIETPTPVQAAPIGPMLQGKDVLAQAQTGTGKTAAYGLPMLQRLDPTDSRIQGLVVLPTRELALQVCKALSSYRGHAPNTSVLALYGGDSFSKQLHALSKHPQVVVATPGRLIDHLERGSVRLDGVRVAVLDEADEMLNMGFLDDVERILDAVPASRQLALLSATMPSEIAGLVDQYLREPARIRIDATVKAAPTVAQRYTICLPELRAEAVARLLDVEPFEAALIFARTKATCDELTDALQRHGVPCEALHGDLAQTAREAVVRRLREGRLRVVVATDVAARGLDVPVLDLVVTIELPGELGTYVHRIGRTGRAGRAGTSILVLGPRDERKLRALERYIGQPIKFQPVPSPEEVAHAKQGRFVDRIRAIAAEPDTAPWKAVIERCLEGEVALADVAAALARLAAPRGVVPVLPEKPPAPEPKPLRDAPPPAVERQEAADRRPTRAKPTAATRPANVPPGTVVMSLGVGRRNNVTPAQIVAALTHCLNVPNRALGRIDLYDNFSTIEVPEEIARRMPLALRGVDVCGRFLNPRPAQRNEDEAPRRGPDRRPR